MDKKFLQIGTLGILLFGSGARAAKADQADQAQKKADKVAPSIGHAASDAWLTAKIKRVDGVKYVRNTLNEKHD